MMRSVHPQSAQDLMLAPVAVEIDSNLQRLRDKSSIQDLLLELELEIDRPIAPVEGADRRKAILEVALRDVHLHGFEVTISDDGSRVHVAGEKQSIDLGLSRTIMEYLESSD